MQLLFDNDNHRDIIFLDKTIWRVRYNVYAPKAERNIANLFKSRHTECLSAWIKVQSAARRELTRADALGHASIKQRCEIPCEALEFSDEHKWLGDLN